MTGKSGYSDMLYKVKLNKTNIGYAIWCPALPGCWTLGETEEEALENIKDAIKAYLESMDEVNQNAELRYVEVR